MVNTKSIAGTPASISFSKVRIINFWDVSSSIGRKDALSDVDEDVDVVLPGGISAELARNALLLLFNIGVPDRGDDGVLVAPRYGVIGANDSAVPTRNAASRTTQAQKPPTRPRRDIDEEGCIGCCFMAYIVLLTAAAFTTAVGLDSQRRESWGAAR